MRETRVNRGEKDLHCPKPLISFVTENGSGPKPGESLIIRGLKMGGRSVGVVAFGEPAERMEAIGNGFAFRDQFPDRFVA